MGLCCKSNLKLLPTVIGNEQSAFPYQNLFLIWIFTHIYSLFRSFSVNEDLQKINIENMKYLVYKK